MGLEACFIQRDDQFVKLLVFLGTKSEVHDVRTIQQDDGITAMGIVAARKGRDRIVAGNDPVERQAILQDLSAAHIGDFGLSECGDVLDILAVRLEISAKQDAGRATQRKAINSDGIREQRILLVVIYRLCIELESAMHANA